MTFKKLLLAATATLGMIAGSAMAQDKPTIGVVVKVGGIPWFTDLEKGIISESKARGWDGFMIGPTSTDPALQVRAIEDLIARGVDAIGVQPNDADVLEPILKRAREAGIIVLTNEATGVVNKDYDFAQLSETAVGQVHAKLLAEAMGGKGEYVVYVGSLTAPAHNAWADAAVAYLEVNHPEMTKVSERFGVAESVDEALSTSLDLMRKFPNLKGFLSMGSQGPIGAGRAIEERGMVGEVANVGLFSAGQGRKMVHSGAITGGFIWSPAGTGIAMVALADIIKSGGEITVGTEVSGLGEILAIEGKNITAEAPMALSVDTIDDLADKGL